EAPTTIQLVNSLGEVIHTPVNQVLSAGSYSIELDASTLPSGVYFVRMNSGQWIAPTKALLIAR
ncbi:MAG: T9SS C-terminal target domain-containing protein, partial [Chlorobiota bacterium]